MDKLIKALPSLLEKQQELDDFIMRERGLTHDETTKQRKLAFVVELSELAQEWRGFKYWSNDQQPSEKTLEEYVDVLHFALSLHNYYRGDTHHVTSVLAGVSEKEIFLNSTPLEMFLETLKHCGDEYHWSNGVSLLLVLLLAKRLGLGESSILVEYDRKYQVNIIRQIKGY